jgi:hypothetical protein
LPYRWLSRPEITRVLGQMAGPALTAYFDLREKLEEDPRSEQAGAVPSREDNDPYVTWIASFGVSGLLIYRILDWRSRPSIRSC